MIIDKSIRLQNIKLAVSLIGTIPSATREFEINQIRTWAKQMELLANDLESSK